MSKFHATKRKDNGRYIATYYINLQDGTKKRKQISDTDKRRLKERWLNVVADNAKGVAIDTKNITVASYLNSWIESVCGIKETTRKGYRSIISSHIIPRIGNIRLSNLTSSHVQKLVRDIIRDGNSVRTTQLVKVVLSRSLRVAEGQNLVRPNIMKYIELEKYIPKTRNIWSVEEMQVFRNAIKGESYRFFYEMYITYGLRRGEAIALKWKDVDFKNKIIHIEREAIVEKGGSVLSSLKTECSERDLPLVPPIVDLLDEMKPTKKSDDDFILSKNGNLINPDSVSRRFKVISKNMGLPIVVLHSLRHFVATTLKNADVAPSDAQKILGHATPITTLKYYQHSNIDDKRRALEKAMKYANFC